MSIALLYERSENDENGIKLTAQQLGIELAFIPFRKIALSISKDGFSAKTKGKDYTQTIQEHQSRPQPRPKQKPPPPSLIHHGNARQKNPQLLPNEFICYSKLRTLLHLFKAGIPIPKTVFVPCDATDMMKNGKEIHNEKDIADLFEAGNPNRAGHRD